jgi:hypothetical protein
MAYELKSRFPRNYNIEKNDMKMYNKLEESNEIFKNKNHKDIFLMSLVLGFKNKVSKRMNSPYPLINCSSFTNRETWLIASIAIEDKGLGVLNDMNEIRKIAEGYANAGFEILQKKLFEEKPGEVLNHFESEVIEILNSD